MCCIWGRSTTPSGRPGAAPSRSSTRTAAPSAQMALFPEDRPAPELACAVVQVKLSGLQLRRPAPMGRLLAGLRAVGPAATGRLLAAAPAAQPQGDPLAECAQDPGGLPSDRPGQRMAPAPSLVRSQCDGRPARRGLCDRPQPHPLSLSGSSGGAQAGAVLLPSGALARPLRCPLRHPALRSDQHLFRMRPAGARQAQIRLQP